MLKEFKNFIMTGNVIEFAVAVILAGAVGLVVNGFVNDIIMPVVGQFAGGMDFASLNMYCHQQLLTLVVLLQRQKMPCVMVLGSIRLST